MKHTLCADDSSYSHIHLSSLDFGFSFPGMLMEKAGHKWRHGIFWKAKTPKREYTITLPVVISGFMKEHMSKKNLLMDSEGDYNIK